MRSVRDFPDRPQTGGDAWSIAQAEDAFRNRPGSRKYRHVRNDSSDRRGSWFGLYKEGEDEEAFPMGSEIEFEQSTVSRRSSKRSDGDTSWRRGSYFGLYSQKPVIEETQSVTAGRKVAPMSARFAAQYDEWVQHYWRKREKAEPEPEPIKSHVLPQSLKLLHSDSIVNDGIADSREWYDEAERRGYFGTYPNPKTTDTWTRMVVEHEEEVTGHEIETLRYSYLAPDLYEKELAKDKYIEGVRESRRKLLERLMEERSQQQLKAESHALLEEAKRKRAHELREQERQEAVRCRTASRLHFETLFYFHVCVSLLPTGIPAETKGN